MSASTGESMSKPIVAIIPGHSSDSPGAISCDGVTEYKWHSELAKSIVDALGELGVKGELLRRGRSGSYESRMTKLAEKCAKVKADLVVELHFNMAAPGYYGQWGGVMAMHYPGSTWGMTLAGDLSDGLHELAGLNISSAYRGPYGTKIDWDGAELYILTRTEAPAVLLETHYGDKRSEHELMTELRDSGKLGANIAASIAKTLDRMKRLHEGVL